MIIPDNMVLRKGISCRYSLWTSKMDGSGVTDSTASRSTSRPESRMFMSSFRRAVKSARVTFPTGWTPASKRKEHGPSASTPEATYGTVTIGHVVPAIEVLTPQAERTNLNPVASTEARETKPMGRKLMAPKPTLNTIICELDTERGRSGAEPGSVLQSAIDKPITATEPRRSTYSVWPTPLPPPTRRTTPSPSQKLATPAVAPEIPKKSAARKRSMVDMGDDFANKRDQMRNDIKTLRHKSSFLDETLKQTVHHRLAVVAEMEAMNQDMDILDKPADSAISILSRPRPVSRATTPRNSERPFWEARASSALSMRPDIDPCASSESILLFPPESPSTLEPRTTAEVQKLSVIRAVPTRISSLPKQRPQALKRSVSLGHAKSVIRAESPMRIASQGKRLNKSLVQDEGAVKDSTFDKVIEMWKRSSASSGHLEGRGR